MKHTTFYGTAILTLSALVSFHAIASNVAGEKTASPVGFYAESYHANTSYNTSSSAGNTFVMSNTQRSDVVKFES